MHVVAHQCHNGIRRGAERHDDKIGAGRLLEVVGGEVLHAARADGADVQDARFLAHRLEEIVERLERGFGAEQGVKDFTAASWNSLYAKAGTPQNVIDTLNTALHDVLADPDLKARLLALGIDSRASTPAVMNAQLQDDIKMWAAVIEQAGIEKK